MDSLFGVESTDAVRNVLIRLFCPAPSGSMPVLAENAMSYRWADQFIGVRLAGVAMPTGMVSGKRPGVHSQQISIAR